MRNDLEYNLITKERENELPRDSVIYENEMNNYIGMHEGEHIANDIQLLRDMGYNNKMINKVYILLHPESIERAIDYMTEVDGIYQHDFFENNYKLKDRTLCFICNKPRRCHLDYIPEEFLVDNNFDFNDNINNDININNNENLIIKNKETFTCSVCFDDIDEEEKNYNDLPCKHICCTQCWINYLKTLITDAKVEKIKCIDHKCTQLLSEEFILKHIEKDDKIVEKYQKFKKRAEIINDPNKKQCPKPDCDSFLEKPKSKKNKYVKCQNNHEFCFECLRPPHGKSTCEEVLEKDFQIWSKGKVIKKCPKCKIYTEKNEGCNHMTCTSCKYQWCWLCEGEYKYGHYTQGACNGHQFTKANYLTEVKPKDSYLSSYNYRPYNNINRNEVNRRRLLLPRRRRTYFRYDEEQTNCCCSLSKVFFCCFHKINYIQDDIDGFERLNALMIWFFGYFLFFAYQTYNTTSDNNFYYAITKKPYQCLGYIISFLLFICYQIQFTILITPFILICMVYPFFVYKIKMFFSIGKANYYRYNNRYNNYSYNNYRY